MAKRNQPRGTPSGYTAHRVWVVMAERRLSLLWLAGQIDMHPSHVSRVLNGHSPITIEFVDGCCKALGVGERDLFREGARELATAGR